MADASFCLEASANGGENSAIGINAQTGFDSPLRLTLGLF